jgi:elongation factor P--(R)-beta-lysine ligase
MMKTWQKLIDNPQLWERYLVREKVVDGIREFFKTQGFHEVQTPIMVPVPSCEPNLEVFETVLKTFGQQKRAFLIMSPEYAIKKLLAAGIGNCFEMTQVFRNGEEASPQHNSEFTMLEWYRTKADYMDIMSDFEKLLLFLVKKKSLVYQGQIYDLSLPWPRITVAEAFIKYAQIPVETLVNESRLIQTARNKGYQLEEKTSWEQVFYQIFFNEIEPRLKALHRPYFLYDYPVQQASLSKKKEDDPRFAERFEVFIAGIELGNCFSELTDSIEQETRFNRELMERKKLRKIEYPIDRDLIEALKAGLPAAAGIAVGVDRLIMLLADVPTIAETMFFPQKELFDL